MTNPTKLAATQPTKARLCTKYFQPLWPGLLLSTALAVACFLGADILSLVLALPLSPLALAVLLGIAVRIIGVVPQSFEAGINWTLHWFLRAGIVLLGFRVAVQDILSVGAVGLMLVVVAIASTLFLAVSLGRRLGLSDGLSTLIGSGTGICGASAIVAVNGVIKSREQDVACAVAAITVLGTIAMFALPSLAHYLGLSEGIFSIWAGSSIHEVAQAVAAGFSVSDTAGVETSLYKLTRVAMLAPACAAIGFWWQRKNPASEQSKSVAVPLFVIGFAAVVILNSIISLPTQLHGSINALDTLVLTIAMAAMGLKTRLSAIVGLGWRPIALSCVVAVWISALTLAGAILI